MRSILAIAIVLVFATGVSAQPRIDTGARDALKWSHPHAADVLSTGVVVGALVAPCAIDRHWDCLKQEGARVGTALLASMIAKYLLPRERPDGSDNKSFFSQHTSLTCAAVLNTKAWALCPTVGYLRISADKHWATDTIAGGVVGGLTWTIQF